MVTIWHMAAILIITAITETGKYTAGMTLKAVTRQQ